MRTHLAATCLTLIAGMGHSPTTSTHPAHRSDWVVGAMQLGLDPVLVERQLIGATWTYVAAVEQLEAGSPGSVALRDSFHDRIRPGTTLSTFLPLGPEACEPGITNAVTAFDPSTLETVAGARLTVRLCPIRPFSGPALYTGTTISGNTSHHSFNLTNRSCFFLCIQNGTTALEMTLRVVRADPDLGDQRVRVPVVLDLDGPADGCSEVRRYIETLLEQHSRLPDGLEAAADAGFVPLASTHPIALQCA